MAARDYCVLLWQPRNAVARDRAAEAMVGLQNLGWRGVLTDEGVAVWLGPGVKLPVHRFENRSDLVIGETFSPANGPQAPSAPTRSEAADQFCRRLMAETWGRYVIIMPGANGALAVFRDPSGALDCLTWADDGLRIIGSALPSALDATLPPTIALDWEQVATILSAPVALSAGVALQGVTAIAPGAIWVREAASERTVQLWRPIDFIADRRRALAELRTEMAHQVRRCVSSWAMHFPTIMTEISGGLDSAIVAGILAGARHDVAGWINYFTSASEGDERRFARDVAQRHALELTAVHLPDLALSSSRLEVLSQNARPAVNGMDWQYDSDMAIRAAALNADAILTGQGGDAVFFQFLSPRALADRAMTRGPWSVGAIDLLAYARASRCSVWAILTEVVHASFRRGCDPTQERSGIFTRDVPQIAALHPWLEGLADAPPGKRRQIRAITNCQVYHGDSLRTAATNLIHPLLSQPIIECCLAIPAADLTYGARERGLARTAFADDLPPSIQGRKSKGDTTAFYGRAIARSLAELRPLLLDGRLVEQRLLDPVRLEALLHPDALIACSAAAEISLAAMVEMWVQTWEARLGRRSSSA